MGSLANLGIAVALLIPSLVWVAFYKRAAPRYYGVLLFAIGFILWAAIEAGALHESIELLKQRAEARGGANDVGAYQHAIIELGVWLYIVPAVTAAIGANLITHFLLSEKPGK